MIVSLPKIKQNADQSQSLRSYYLMAPSRAWPPPPCFQLVQDVREEQLVELNGDSSHFEENVNLSYRIAIWTWSQTSLNKIPQAHDREDRWSVLSIGYIRRQIRRTGKRKGSWLISDHGCDRLKYFEEMSGMTNRKPSTALYWSSLKIDKWFRSRTWASNMYQWMNNVLTIFLRCDLLETAHDRHCFRCPEMQLRVGVPP